MTYISQSSDLSSFIFCSEIILVLLAKGDLGELHCPVTALILGLALFPIVIIYRFR